MIKRYCCQALLLFALLGSLLCCERETFMTDSSASLEFSVDTVLFDTVFTSVGSVTQRLLVRNPYDEDLKISRIKLARNTTYFRININGYAVDELSDVRLAAKDSLYIFVELTVDPSDDNAPFVVQDSIVFETNGQQQDVDLVAYGQNVHLINGESLATQTWTNDKPYLIYNSMLVDSAQTLTIEAGTQLYFHRGSRLYVLGSLQVNGTQQEPVVFQGDRLEAMYDDVPGQWEGIWLTSISRDNYMDFAEVKNAVIGIQVDTFSTDYAALTLNNCLIQHHSYAGLLAQGSKVVAMNSLFVDCGYYSVALSIGGGYEFYHCTIGNYWGLTSRSTPALLLNNYYQDVNNVLHIRPLWRAYFGNCIIYGSRQDGEIGFDKHPDTPDQQNMYNFQFDHCLFQVDTIDDGTREEPEYIPDFDDPQLFINCIRNPKNFKFKQPLLPDYDYSLDTLSVAKDKGSMDVINNFAYPSFLYTDRNGNNRRADAAPDMGALERLEE